MSIPFLPVNTPSDSVLITRFQSGDPRVFDKLYHRHYSRIHAVILSVVCNPDDAPDALEGALSKDNRIYQTQSERARPRVRL